MQKSPWGYSGGSLASGWAAALQPKYAPELKKNLIGAALGGFVTNITATAEATDGTLFAGLVPNALSGLANEYRIQRNTLPKVSKAATDNLRQGTEHCIEVLFFTLLKTNTSLAMIELSWRLWIT